MSRVKKPTPTIEGLFFSTPEQRVMKFLLGEATSAFSIRVIASKLKGVRGLGGPEGIVRVLTELQELGLVEFFDNNKSVRLQDDNPTVRLLKVFAAICDLEGIRTQIEPIAKRGVLIGSRARGRSRTDSDYNLVVVSDQSREVSDICERHPLGKLIKVAVVSPDDFDRIDKKDPRLAGEVSSGVVLWGSVW